MMHFQCTPGIRERMTSFDGEAVKVPIIPPVPTLSTKSPAIYNVKMPKYYGRKKWYPRTQYKSPYNPRADQSLVRSLQRRLRALESKTRVEYKSRDVTEDDETITTAGQHYLLNPSSRGAGLHQHDGREIHCVSIQINGIFRVNPSAAENSIRWWIVLDKQPNANVFATSEFINDVDGLRNLDNRHRFVTLRQGMLDLSSLKPTHTFSIYKKLNFKTTYDVSETATVADITTNALWFVCISDQAALGPDLYFTSRLRYLDN